MGFDATSLIAALSAQATSVIGAAYTAAIDTAMKVGLWKVIAQALEAEGGMQIMQVISNADYTFTGVIYEVISGNWGTPDLTTTHITFTGSSGVWEVNTDGLININCTMQFFVINANRSGGQIQLQKDVGAGFVNVPEGIVMSYARRNGTINEGGPTISNLFIAVSDGDQFRFRAKYIDQAAVIRDEKARITVIWYPN